MANNLTHAPKLGMVLEAYGIELRLWKEAGEREWGATLQDNGETVNCRFEEDNLTMAKFHVIAEARQRAVSRSGDGEELPGCDAFMNSWKPINLAKA